LCLAFNKDLCINRNNHQKKFRENACVLLKAGFEWGAFFGFDCGFGVWMVLFLDLESKKLIKIIYNCYN
jgi:hypothetical protein